MEDPTTYTELIELYMKYRESRKGKVMRGVLEKLNQIAKTLLKRHDINCYSKQDTKHLKFPCGLSRLFSGAVAGEHSSTHKFTWGVHSTCLSVFILFCFV